MSLWLIILMLKARHLHFKGSEFIKRKLKTLIEKVSFLIELCDVLCCGLGSQSGFGLFDSIVMSKA